MFENALKSDLTSAEQATSETFWNQLELVEWSECEVRISIDWSKIRSNRPNVRYKFRSIGPNSDRMVRILLEWSEFRTNGLNLVLTLQNLSKCWCQERKSAWTDLYKVNFKKYVKESNVEIKKLAWTGLDKVKKGFFQRKCLFKKFLHDWSHKKSWSDKRCSRCYTLRGCVLADVQSREELKMLLQAKRQPG